MEMNIIDTRKRFQNSIQDGIRRYFNALSREDIQRGAKIVHMMNEDNSIEPMAVEVAKPGYAILRDGEGAQWGVVFE